MSTESPTIDSFELARTGRQLDGKVAVAQLPRLAEFVASAQGALSYRIRGLIDAEGYPAADLQVEGPLQLICQRCNSPLNFRLDRKARFRFAANEEELNSMPVEDDEIESIVGMVSLNVHDWLEDEAILSLPLVPRHDECSPPLSAEGGSDTAVVSNPFAVLLELRGHDGDNKRRN